MVPPHFVAASFLRAATLAPDHGGGPSELTEPFFFGGLFFSALGRVFVVRSQTALTAMGGSLDCSRGRLVVSVFALSESTLREALFGHR